MLKLEMKDRTKTSETAVYYMEEKDVLKLPDIPVLQMKCHKRYDCPNQHCGTTFFAGNIQFSQYQVAGHQNRRGNDIG